MRQRAAPGAATLLACLVCGGGGACGADDDLLERVGLTKHDRQRYEKTWERNPFNIKTAPVIVNKPSFEKDYAVQGVSVIGGKTTVLLYNLKTKEYEMVTGDESESGFRVVSVKRDPNPLKVEVVMARDGQEATLKYSETLLAAKPKPKAGAKPGGLPGKGITQAGLTGAAAAMAAERNPALMNGAAPRASSTSTAAAAAAKPASAPSATPEPVPGLDEDTVRTRRRIQLPPPAASP